MKKRERYKRILLFISSAVLITLMTAIYAVAWYRVYSPALSEPYYRRGNYAIIALYAVMLVFFYKIYGGFKVGRLRVMEVLFSQILSLLCVNSITHLQLCLIGNWSFTANLTSMLVMTLVDVLVMMLWITLTRWFYVKIYPPRKLLAIYGQYSPDDLIRKIDAREDKYAIQEAISCDQDVELIKQKVDQYENVILMDIPDEIRNKLLKYCFEKDIRCYTVPKISDILIRKASEIHMFDTPLLLFRNIGLTVEQRFLKRVFDVIVSLVFFVVAFPVMLLIGLLIKAYDGGPVFFTQDRLTENGRVFKLYKFRSMRVSGEDEEYVLTRKGDDRITPVGKVLRNIHFDELPQIYNILKGDMSFVGPRPECPKLAKEYCQIVPEFQYRLKVKAGLTGYAQVYGKYNTTPYDKLKLDLTYIQNYSFLLDLNLMLLTFKVLFQKENTEGIESWQTTAATKENLEKVGKY